MIPFAPFEPDRSKFNANVASVLRNVTVREDHVGPFPSLVTYSSALASAPRGATLAWNTSGTPTVFVGTATKLYKLNTSTLGWDDVTRLSGGDYTLGTEDVWQFTQFGEWLIATSQSGDPQYFDLGSSTNFAALAGSPGAQLACLTVGDYLMFANGTTVKWSGLNAPTVYTPRRQGSDFQPLPDGGNIQTIVHYGSGALLAQERAIREMIPQYDNRIIFRIEKSNEQRGIISPRSMVSIGDQAFFIAKDGLFQYGRPSVPIGFEKVDRYLLDSLDLNRLFLTEVVRDPVNQVIYWRYKTTASTSDETTNKILAYNYRLQRYSEMEIELTGLLAATTPGYTLEGLNSFAGGLESLPFPLDSAAWAASTPVLGGFNASYELGLFQGNPLEAVITTGSVQLLKGGKRAFVNGFRPIVDNPHSQSARVSARVGIKGAHGKSTTWKAPADLIEETGIIPARAEARLHEFEVTIPATTGWTSAHGIEFDEGHIVEAGVR